jgi:hypothetical protein
MAGAAPCPPGSQGGSPGSYAGRPLWVPSAYRFVKPRYVWFLLPLAFYTPSPGIGGGCSGCRFACACPGEFHLDWRELSFFFNQKKLSGRRCPP